MRTIIAVLLAAILFAATATAAEGPTTSPRNCRMLSHLGSKMVCDDEPEVVAEVPVPAPEVIHTTTTVEVPSGTFTEADHVTMCFPVGDWNANGEDRPCDTLRRPYEDGSTRLTLGTYGAPAARCTIPNPYEEQHRFVIHCHRVRNH